MHWVEMLEQLKEAVGIVSTDKTLAASERRQYFRSSRRIGLRGEILTGEKLHLMGSNISPAGLRLEAPRRLKVGEHVRLYIPNKKPRTAEELEELFVHVVWCKRRPGTPVFDCGTKFIISNAVEKKTVARFLLEDCQLGVLNPEEKRKTARLSVELKGEVGEANGQRTQVEVRDLAVRGALLISPSPLVPGTQVDITVRLSDKQKTLECQGEVMRCQKLESDGLYELGVYFSRVAADHLERLTDYLSRSLKQQSL